MWVVLGGETLTVDVGLSTVNDLANPLYMDMRVFESAGDAARFVALHNPAGLEHAGGVRLWNHGGGYMRANQDDSLAMTEASSVALLVHKNLTGGDPTCERIEVPQKIIVMTGTNPHGKTAEAGGGWSPPSLRPTRTRTPLVTHSSRRRGLGSRFACVVCLSGLPNTRAP